MTVAVALDADMLLAQAQLETGLSDYGDDTLPDRLRRVIAEIRKVGMDGAGEAEACKVVLWLLTSRLQVFEDRKRFPIADEEIVRPVFATGDPRSGTTLLHALLSVDPNGRALRFWEVMYPSPPPGLATSDDDRRRRADEDWRDILERIPRWLVSHPYNDMLGDGLPECERTWAFDFRALTPTAWWRVPMIANSNLPTDAAAQYRLHKMMLQQFQYNRPPKYWVLKGFHGHRLRELFATYPDAAMIWVHRDPLVTLASRIVLVGQINEAMAGSLDWAAFARENVAAMRASLKAYLADPMLSDSRIRHVRYTDFVSDPVGTVRDFYEASSIPFTPATEQAMRTYLADNRGDRYGKFEYSLDVIGEDLDALDREFEPYRERFGIARERRGELSHA